MIELKAHSSDYISQFAPATETFCCDFSASAQMKEFETRISLPLCIAAEPTAPPGRESPAGAVLDGLVPRPGLLLLVSPTWKRRKHQSAWSILNKGQMGNAAQKSVIGSETKQDMGLRMREIYRIWFPYL